MLILDILTYIWYIVVTPQQPLEWNLTTLFHIMVVTLKVSQENLLSSTIPIKMKQKRLQIICVFDMIWQRLFMHE